MGDVDDMYPEANVSETKETRLDMGLFVSKLVQFHVSDKAGAQLWNAVVKCMTNAGYIENDSSSIIKEDLIADHRKIEREDS